MKIVIASSIFLYCGFSFAQGVWTQKADFGSTARVGAVGFSIGNKGYLGTGIDSVYRKDFWEYDPALNSWTQQADFAGTARYGAVGFSIGIKGYIGTGQDSTGYKKDFWEYDPTLNSWTQQADFGGSARAYAVGFYVGNYGYIGTGELSSGYTYDFWEYNPTSDIWIQKSDLSNGGGRYGATGFSAGNKGYIGFGWDITASQQVSDLFEYNPINDSWSNVAWAGSPSPRFFSVGFSIDTNGYIGTGVYSVLPFPNIPTPSFSDFFQYDSLNGAWTQKAIFGGGIRGYAVGFSIGNYGYIGTGKDNTGTLYNDFWEYSPLTAINENNVKVNVSVFPNPFNKITSLKISSSDNHINNSDQLKIFNLNGQGVSDNFQLKQYSDKEGICINIENKHSNKGVYFYEVKIENNIVHRGKFIIQ